MINDIYASAERIYLKCGWHSKSSQIYYMVLSDMNLFSEKKTNLGLFFLLTPLNMHLFCQGCDLVSLPLLLLNLKMRII